MEALPLNGLCVPARIVKSKGESFMMKNHGLRRIFSLFLAVFMVCALLPTAAFAEDTTETESAVTEAPQLEAPQEPKQEEAKTFTVTYTDGADGAAFADQVYGNLTSGTATPAFNGAPAREGYTFQGWNPAVAETVTEDVTYTAKWEEAVQAAVQSTENGSQKVVTYKSSKDDSRIDYDEDVSIRNSGRTPMVFYIIYHANYPGGGQYIVQYTVSGVNNPGTNGYTVSSDKFKTYAACGFAPTGYEPSTNGSTWYTNPECTNKASDSIHVGTFQKLHFYASWKEKSAPETQYTFTLNYDANEGTGAPASANHSEKSAKDTLSHTFTVSDTEPTRENYTFKGWSTEKDGTAEYYAGNDYALTATKGNPSVSATLYAVWEENAPVKPDAPDKDWVIEKYKDVTVECVNTVANHGSKNYDLEADSILPFGEVEDGATAGTYTCVVTISAASYVNKFNAEKGDHDSINPTVSMQLLYYSGEWHAPSSDEFPIIPIVFKVKCDTKPEPTTPGEGDLEGIDLVEIVCDRNAHDTKTYSVIAGSCEFGKVDKSGDAYTCDVIINAQKYVDRYNEDVTGITHTLVGESSVRLTLRWDAEKQTWSPMTDTPVTFEVTCPPAAPSHDQLQELIGKIKVNCTNGTASHTPKSEEYDLKEDSYTPGTVEGDAENGYTYTITIKSEEYVKDFDTTTRATHTPKTGEATVILEYNGKEQVWTVKTELPVTFNVACEKEPYTPGGDEVKQLLGNGAVQIICTNEPSGHGTASYRLIDGTFEVRRNGRFCEVVIKSSNEYVAQFNTDVGVAQGTHASDAKTPDKTTINLKWVDGEWKVVDAPAKYYVLCETETAPGAPKATELGNIVKVTCTTKTAHGTEAYPLTAGDFSIGNVTGNAKDGYTCTITAKAAKYVASYVGAKGAHTYTGSESKSVTLSWNAAANKWDVPEGTAITFEVTCKDEVVKPEKPTFEELPEISVIIDCGTTGEHKDAKFALMTKSYEISDVINLGNTYTCTLTVKAEKYVDEYSSNLYRVGKHELDDAAGKDIILNWNGQKWVAEKDSVTFHVKCKLHTVTYEDGAKGKAFKTQEYKDLAYGVDTPKFNGTPKRTGYTFTGWSPKVTDTVTKDVTYVAQWKSTKNGKDNVPKTGDGQMVMILGSVLMFSFCGAAAVCVYDRKRKQG